VTASLPAEQWSDREGQTFADGELDVAGRGMVVVDAEEHRGRATGGRV